MMIYRYLYFILYTLCFSAALIGCADQEGEWFDEPFVRISTDTGQSSTVVLSDVKNVNTYTVYLSSTPLTEELTVDYEVIVGDGLQSGVDYELVTQGNTLSFLPGIYTMPVRIRWMPHRVDPSKDNTLTIRLTGNSRSFTLGYPGPEHLQRQLVIEKKND